MEIPNHPTAYSIVTIISTMLLTSIIQWIFLIVLKRRHRDQWYHAGTPTIWSDQSLLSAWLTIKYLQNKLYLSSGSAGGIHFCKLFRLPMVLGYWLTIAIFSVGIIVCIMNGWPPS
ncbi:hypothetical protein [Spartinivicinus poritis]|uniref:ATP synthase F0 subunit 8 n=1 Tax=Spartinivicinus poritis TaxID=2994640 RepID=A0ABT5UGQ6_9GAMM|nr:hypothetical protein [Spartinivicinus sp. A2-2]MDE1465573.1 hypothetical protein [Spartinivicinus sp. A2-2]